MTETLARLERGARRALAETALDRPDLEEKLATYLNEVPVAIALLGPVLPKPGEGRILEVGGGVGAVSACLAHLGHTVVAVEPAGPGFEDMALLQRAVERAVQALPESAGSRVVLPIAVEDLDPDVHGSFDVVFSANVLEHVDDPMLALDRMQAMLCEGGVQRHLCPNYTFPYEPHYFLPLLPVRPAATERFLPTDITETGLWQSLNFVTAHLVRRWVSGRGLQIEFDHGVLAEAFERFEADPLFAERHGKLGRAVRLLRNLGLVSLVRRVPAGLVSPMRFTIWR